jgi:hypothetical protein
MRLHLYKIEAHESFNCEGREREEVETRELNTRFNIKNGWGASSKFFFFFFRRMSQSGGGPGDYSGNILISYDVALTILGIEHK